MSHKWTNEAYGKISSNAMATMQQAVQLLAWFISYDNLNIPMRVFSQRLHNQDHFHSTCAKQPFDVTAVLAVGNKQAMAWIRAQHIHHILLMLLDSPAFASYKHCNDPILGAPPLTHLLPCGPENVSSYEGNDKAKWRWQAQMGIDSPDEKRKTAFERLIPIVGDQLTMEHLRGLQKFRHDGINSYDRDDYQVLQIGWFHALMYRGTAGGYGLQRAIDNVQKSNQKVSSQLPHRLTGWLIRLGALAGCAPTGTVI
ncbi:hypothetical protein OF83DRAFT_1166444 [Amylostereum chailletii]|nr:hypothetical protein OF83DRAFT_1166444 [Amylostereum chailletii]